jgi:hypothetical protein
MNAKTFFTDRPIAYHPILAKVFGSVTAALFLSQIGYWSDKGADPSGWIWKTESEMTEETGLSRSEQQTARELLVWTGVLHEKRKGVPARMWFKIDWDMLDIAMVEYENERVAQQVAEIPQPVVENQQQDAEIPQTIHRLPENTPSLEEDIFGKKENAAEKAKQSVRDILANPSIGKRAGVSNARKGKQDDISKLAAIVASIQAQTEIPVNVFLDRGVSFTTPYIKAVEPLFQDVKEGVFSITDIDDAAKHLMNGDGEKYRKLTFSPSTIVGHIAEIIAKTKNGEIAKPQTAVKNADGSYYL